MESLAMLLTAGGALLTGIGSIIYQVRQARTERRNTELAKTLANAARDEVRILRRGMKKLRAQHLDCEKRGVAQDAKIEQYDREAQEMRGELQALRNIVMEGK